MLWHIVRMCAHVCLCTFSVFERRHHKIIFGANACRQKPMSIIYSSLLILFFPQRRQIISSNIKKNYYDFFLLCSRCTHLSISAHEAEPRRVENSSAAAAVNQSTSLSTSSMERFVYGEWKKTDQKNTFNNCQHCMDQLKNAIELRDKRFNVKYESPFFQVFIFTFIHL